MGIRRVVYMILECVVTEPFQSNCWIVGCETTKDAVVIDPGNEEAMARLLNTHALTPTHLIHTHGHLDHVSGTAAIQRATGAPVLIHEADRILLENLALQATMFGLAAPQCPTVDRYISEGDRIAFGVHVLSVLETPGHSPGGVCLKLEEGTMVFAGDTLFRGSIGRTDLWGGDHQQLLNSIREKLWPLDDATVVYPGHGPKTTIGTERRENPFLQGL